MSTVNTNNKREEEILSDKLIVAALNSADILVSIMKKDTTIVYVNKPNERVLLYKPEELIGKKGIELAHPEDKKRLLAKLAKYTKEFINLTLQNFLSGEIKPFSETVEYRVRDKEGNWHWLESVGTIIKGKLYNISKEITERKQAEHELAEQNKYNRVRAEVWKIASDKTLREDQLIQKLLNIVGPAFGVSRACYNKFTGADPYKSDLECVFEWCDKRVKPSVGEKYPPMLIKHFLKEDFSVLTAETALEKIPQPQRIIVKPIITLLAKTQNIESLALMPHYINNTVVGMLTFDICGNNKTKLVWTDEIVSIIKEIVNIVSNHIAQIQVEAELEKHRNNLEELVIKRSDELIKTNEQLQNEIKERKRTEDALRRAEKMETIGLMAGGVAHDLNNILAGIVSCPDMLLLELPQDSPLRELALAIRTSGLKASAVVQDLLLLSKSGFTPLEVICLNDVISEYRNSLEHENVSASHKDITFEFNIDKNLMNISGSPVHLSKVIMNLVLNAAEAMAGSGTIAVLTKNEYIDHPLKGYETIDEGHYVVLSVSDTGKGIAIKDLERIFEPFYTKKIMNRSGTGLGLAIVWKTMKDHNGYIDVLSTENKGTRLNLYFPATSKSIPSTNTPIPIEEYQSRGEKILIIDDNKGQRNIAQKMLSKLRYDVTTVKSGEEAVKYLKKNSVDLLVMDMIMEDGIDGLETYREIIKLNPTQKAIITSGFSETDRVKDAQNLGAGKYLKKPYTFESLGTAVREELDK